LGDEWNVGNYYKINNIFNFTLLVYRTGSCNDSTGSNGDINAYSGYCNFLDGSGGLRMGLNIFMSAIFAAIMLPGSLLSYKIMEYLGRTPFESTRMAWAGVFVVWFVIAMAANVQVED
jgi:hypothetical protein